MGLTGSSYRIALGPASGQQSKTYEWLGKPGSNLHVPIKAESFENVKPIGKGKFGVVFLAKTNESDKPTRYVAIKYIAKQIIFDTQTLDKIQNEMDYLVKFNHPNSVFCWGAFETPASFGIVMEYCVGGELYHRMKQRVKISTAEAKFYFVELVSVLKYLHEEMQVVYRDLKPENILLDYSGHVKLVDFGFATQCDKMDNTLYDTCGTAMYIAPEVVNKAKYGYSVDYWALGCILFEMITGHAPFGDSDNMNKFEIFNNITEKAVALPLFMSSTLKTLLKGLLNKNQAERWTYVQIEESAWCQDINWRDVQAQRLVPPFIPTKGESVAGSVENFVAWELSLPSVPGSSDVQTYCRALRLPKPKAGGGGGGGGGGNTAAMTPSPSFREPGGGASGGGEALKKGKSVKKVSISSPGGAEGPGVGILVPAASTSKLKKSKSKIQNEEQGVMDKDEVLEDSPPNLRRAKSKSGGAEGSSKPKSGNAKQKSKKSM